MSSFQVTGKLIKAGPTESKSDKFQVRELVIEIPGNYPQLIAFQLAQDRCGLLDDYQEGEEIIVHFDLRGREWNGKYFTNLNAWKLERANHVGAPQPAAPAPEPVAPAPTTDAPAADGEELPF